MNNAALLNGKKTDVNEEAKLFAYNDRLDSVTLGSMPESNYTS